MNRQNFFFLVALLFACNTLFAPEFMISTNGLIPGVYFMRIYRNGEFLDTQKLIVK